MTADRVLRLREGKLAWREVEGEVVGVALERGEYFAITGAGTVLWPALAEGTTREELVTRLAERFALDRATAERDVDAFVAGLDGWELLVP